MHSLKLTTVALALGAALAPAAQAQSNADLLKELAALKARVSELEKKLTEPANIAQKQWGMTPEQAQEFNRIAVKTESIEDNIESQGLKSLKFSGYMDPTYIYNKNQHRAGFQFINPVDSDGYNYDNSYFGVVSLDFQKELEGGTKWRLTLMPNRGAGSVFGDRSIVHEASVSVPLGDLATRLIAGQIPDWSGYEYIQPTTTKLVTRGLLLDFTEPTAYTAAGMEIISGKWDMKGVVGNFNTSLRAAGQKSPVLAYRVDYSKGEFNGFGFAGVHGKAANFSQNVLDELGNVMPQEDSRLDIFEADAYFIRGDLTLQGQVGVGRQKYASITPAPDGSLRDARWWGLSGLAAYKLTPRFEVVSRLDYINDHANGGGLLGYNVADSRNGFGPDQTGGDPNIGANRYALAIGFNYLLTLNTTIKAEYRLDRATQAVFLDTADNSYRKSNQLLGASLVVGF